VRKLTAEQQLYRQSQDAQNEAQKLPHGKERQALVKKARQLDTASHVYDWLSSADLKPPN
jgi:hypothetical protein